MLHYVWQKTAWPLFAWSADDLAKPLATLRKAQGALRATLNFLGFDENLEVYGERLEADALSTAKIEGVELRPEEIRSSIARHLGLNTAGLKPAPRNVDNLVLMLLDATHKREPLDEERLFGWHRALFPDGSNGLYRILAGTWRTSAMEVVSGQFGREKVHFEAVPAEKVPQEMVSFFEWFNEESLKLDGVVRAAVAHLRFLTIHPFDDGNGRIARAIADMALAQDDGFSQRYYSLSQTLLDKKNEYYEILEKTQKSDGDITEWLLWFIGAVQSAVDTSGSLMEDTRFKAEYWRRFEDVDVSLRQKKVINKLFEFGRKGMEGGLTTRKYIGWTKSSRATAWREIEALCQAGMLRQRGAGGRSTSYELPWPENTGDKKGRSS